MENTETEVKLIRVLEIERETIVVALELLIMTENEYIAQLSPFQCIEQAMATGAICIAKDLIGRLS